MSLSLYESREAFTLPTTDFVSPNLFTLSPFCVADWEKKGTVRERVRKTEREDLKNIKVCYELQKLCDKLGLD